MKMPEPGQDQDERRRELGAFLRARREQVLRSDLGLAPTGRGQELGLRREEIAVLSGISVTWYTWLEQGRDINPSRQVLEAIARTLRLTGAQHDYMLALLGLAPLGGAAAEPDAQRIPDHVQRFLDSLEDQPAYALAPGWDLAGWNRAYETLYPNVARLAPGDRNLLWVVFTDPAVRRLLDDWEVTSRRFLAEFRAEAGPRLSDRRYRAVIDRLLEASPEFTAGWHDHDISGFQSRLRVFHHSEAGRLVFEQHQMRPSDHPEVQLVIYTSADASTRERFAEVAGDRA